MWLEERLAEASDAANAKSGKVLLAAKTDGGASTFSDTVAFTLCE